MSIDMSPQAAPGQPLINTCGNGGFQIAGIRHTGSVVIVDGAALPWSAPASEEIDAASLGEVLAAGREGAILVVGCGERFFAPPVGLREDVRAKGPVLEWMDTRAACRTFNVLLIERRDVAAALIAIS